MMEDKKVLLNEDGKVDLDINLLMLHLLGRIRQEGIINWETYSKCVRDIKSEMKENKYQKSKLE